MRAIEQLAADLQDLPDLVPCSWSGEPLKLKYALPKIWSQMSSRPFGIYWSQTLSYGRLWPEPTEAELNSFYNIAGANEYLGGPKERTPPKPNLLSRVIVKIAWVNDHGTVESTPTILSLSKPHPEICDIGCGVGTFLSRMRDHGAIVTGVDPSSVSAEALRSKDIEFYSGVAESLPAALCDRRFDVVTMLHCLPCCRDPALAVSNALSLLKPDGFLVVEVSNMGCLGFLKYGPAWWHTDAGRNLHFFTKASLTTLLERVGATPIKWEYRGFVTQFTQGWIDTMDAVWESLFQGRSTSVPRPSLLNSLSYLPRALVSNKSKKYEVIRVYAKLSR
jgi:2-polyprenyl-3-methyl-5-hydroxy-6-metoxy-1,4-benzoquinol methylase